MYLLFAILDDEGCTKTNSSKDHTKFAKYRYSSLADFFVGYWLASNLNAKNQDWFIVF